MMVSGESEICFIKNIRLESNASSSGSYLNLPSGWPSLRRTGRELVAIGRLRLWTDGAMSPGRDRFPCEEPNPVLRSTESDITHQFRSSEAPEINAPKSPEIALAK
jgi:hypothetical protein